MHAAQLAAVRLSGPDGFLQAARGLLAAMEVSVCRGGSSWPDQHAAAGVSVFVKLCDGVDEVLVFFPGCKQLATHWPSRSARQLCPYSRYKACLLQPLCYSFLHLHIQHVWSAALGGCGLFALVLLPEQHGFPCSAASQAAQTLQGLTSCRNTAGPHRPGGYTRTVCGPASTACPVCSLDQQHAQRHAPHRCQHNVVWGQPHTTVLCEACVGCTKPGPASQSTGTLGVSKCCRSSGSRGTQPAVIRTAVQWWKCCDALTGALPFMGEFSKGPESLHKVIHKGRVESA